MGRAFQIIEVAQERFNEERYFEHRRKAEAFIKEIKKEDKKRQARIEFYSKH